MATTAPRDHQSKETESSSQEAVAEEAVDWTEKFPEFLGEPSFIVDQENVITWANEAFLGAFKLKGGKVIRQMSCEEACGNHLCGTKNCPVAKASRIGKPVDTETLQEIRRQLDGFLFHRRVALDAVPN